MHRLVAYALILAVFVGGFWYLGAPNRVKWNEEVVLSSGERLMTRRTATLKAYQPIADAGYVAILGMTLEITSPARPDNPAPWSGKLIPMILDRDPGNREWFVVARINTCQDWTDIGRPVLPYAEFRHRNGQWFLQPLSEKFVGREANLYTGLDADRIANQSLEVKYEWQNDITFHESHRRVVNKPSRCGP